MVSLSSFCMTPNGVRCLHKIDSSTNIRPENGSRAFSYLYKYLKMEQSTCHNTYQIKFRLIYLHRTRAIYSLMSSLMQSKSLGDPAQPTNPG